MKNGMLWYKEEVDAEGGGPAAVAADRGPIRQQELAGSCVPEPKVPSFVVLYKVRARIVRNLSKFPRRIWDSQQAVRVAERIEKDGGGPARTLSASMGRAVILQHQNGI